MGGSIHGLGCVGLGRDFAVFDGLSWVGSNSDKSTIFSDDYTTYKYQLSCSAVVEKFTY